MSLDLSSLNPPQREAVLHGTGPLVVFAGAGSGKTRVITYRIVRLVAELGVPADRILAVTFTNKAAAEMRTRILSLLSQAEPGDEAPAGGFGGGRGPWIGTFHSICARLLRRYAEALGISPRFVIYDDTDQKAMVTRVLRDLGVDERRHPPREIMRFIEQQKQNLLRPGEGRARSAADEVGERVYEQYEQRMQQSGALDFNDLLTRTVYGLRESAQMRFDLERRWEHLLVDEFQDTNLVQLELVRILAGKHRNLCVVGDDDQSIYKWRGADRRNILDFRASFPDAQVIKLEQNYRSSGHILATAMAVISRNAEREPKNLFTQNPPGDKVRVVVCPDERDEARAVREAVRTLRDHGQGLAEMAVFYRTHAQSRVLEEELRAANIPYRVIGGQRFYERAEVKDVLAYLRVLANPNDDVSLLRIINTPARGIGKTTIDRVLEVAARRGIGVWDVITGPGLDEAAGKAALGKVAAFVQLIQKLTEQAASGMGPASLADEMLEHTGYLSALRDADSAEADGRIENVQELVAAMREFENEAETPTLDQYLELITLETNLDELDSSEKLTLMTVHGSKGLEFPVVWVAGLEERLFPLSRDAFISEEDLEEERRLAYVAFTRAEQRLFLSYACSRRLHGDMMLGLPSRFLKEIPEAHMVPISRLPPEAPQARFGRPAFGGGAQQGFMGASRSSPPADPGGARYEYDQPRGGFGAGRSSPQLAWSGGRSAPPPAARGPSRRPGESYIDRSEAEGLEGLREGGHVRHAKYGEGEVLSVEAGKPPRVTVRFAGWGVKQILASYLEPA
jgi:DNA helicase-2/ATP-dependent DNA helicase PcrA